MQRRIWIVSITAALAGMALLRWHVHRLEQEVSGGPTSSVLVLARDAGEATALTRDLLGVRRLPQAYLESRHVRERDLDQVLGARLGVPARAGEALLWTDLASVRAQARPVSRLVPDGMRAVSLARAASGMDELLSAGDRVDVLQTHERGAAAPAGATVVAENLLVLAVGSGPGTATRARREGSVMVSVTPDQGLRLAAAERSGSLRVVLRNPDDLAITAERQ